MAARTVVPTTSLSLQLDSEAARRGRSRIGTTNTWGGCFTDAGVANIRCMFIGPPDLFAFVPLQEATKVLLSKAAAHEQELREGKWQRTKLAFIDVKKTRLNCTLGPDKVAFAQLPRSPSRK